MKRKKPSAIFPAISDVASATETTGLMPADPEDEAAFEALQMLAGMEIPEKKEP